MRGNVNRRAEPEVPSWRKGIYVDAGRNACLKN